MRETAGARRRGRWAEGRRNDDAVIGAARDALRADPAASMAQIAEVAEVGVGSLYRRYPNREALVLRVCLDGMLRVETLARAALADLDRLGADPWTTFGAFAAGAVAAGAGSFTHLAGTLAPTDELLAAAERRHATVAELLRRTQKAGAVRDDLTGADLELLLGQLQSVPVADPDRVDGLRRRYLGVLLDGLRASGASPLHDPPARYRDIRDRWL